MPGSFPNQILSALGVDRRARQWESSIRSGSVRTLVAESQGSILGFVTCAATRDEDDDPSRVAEIQAIYVDPAAWGNGIGQRLVASTTAELSDKSYEQLTLWVLKENQRACRFYERAGFSLDGKTKVETIGVPLEVVRYRRTLARG